MEQDIETAYAIKLFSGVANLTVKTAINIRGCKLASIVNHKQLAAAEMQTLPPAASTAPASFNYSGCESVTRSAMNKKSGKLFNNFNKLKRYIHCHDLVTFDLYDSHKFKPLRLSS